MASAGVAGCSGKLNRTRRQLVQEVDKLANEVDKLVHENEELKQALAKVQDKNMHLRACVMNVGERADYRIRAWRELYFRRCPGSAEEREFRRRELRGQECTPIPQGAPPPPELIRRVRPAAGVPCSRPAEPRRAAPAGPCEGRRPPRGQRRAKRRGARRPTQAAAQPGAEPDAEPGKPDAAEPAQRLADAPPGSDLPARSLPSDVATAVDPAVPGADTVVGEGADDSAEARGSGRGAAVAEEQAKEEKAPEHGQKSEAPTELAKHLVQKSAVQEASPVPPRAAEELPEPEAEADAAGGQERSPPQRHELECAGRVQQAAADAETGEVAAPEDKCRDAERRKVRQKRKDKKRGAKEKKAEKTQAKENATGEAKERQVQGSEPQPSETGAMETEQEAATEPPAGSAPERPAATRSAAESTAIAIPRKVVQAEGGGRAAVHAAQQRAWAAVVHEAAVWESKQAHKEEQAQLQAAERAAAQERKAAARRVEVERRRAAAVQKVVSEEEKRRSVQCAAESQQRATWAKEHRAALEHLQRRQGAGLRATEAAGQRKLEEAPRPKPEAARPTVRLRSGRVAPVDFSKGVPHRKVTLGSAQRLLPPQRPPGRKTVVFDLDETLVKYKHPKTGQPAKKDDGMYFRRGAMQLLREVAQAGAEVVLWTAGAACYAEPLTTLLDPSGVVEHVVARHSVWFKDGNTYTKDLRCLGRPLSTVILVDNNTQCAARTPENTVIVPDYTGDDEVDPVCEKLQRLLTGWIQSDVPAATWLTENAGKKAVNTTVGGIKHVAHLSAGLLQRT
eukprot:TRINITY_DN9186_c0_g3_i1.p1 TRINITY_DN9186_c0_g3~~TRINITY_DN9186_c0_g3_i1.p1  ORF type:complete len:793 (+),score=156.35 TRINITY_DN9186_c0_g3_i1:68-2446(+)